jgi:large subunit ribosomal protein L25
VDFYVVKMTEELTLDVPVNYAGESHAVEKMGGTLLHLREHISVRALPAELPHALDLDVSPLDSFETILHVRDLIVPAGVTVLTDADEPLARVQPPRVEEELFPGAVAAEALAGTPTESRETVGEAAPTTDAS